MRRWQFIAVLAALAGSATVASAQFTTVVVPPRNTAADSTAAVARADSAQLKDSITVAMRLKDMKSWVDSAAGIAAAQQTGSDSAALAAVPPQRGADSIATADTARQAVATVTDSTETTFRNGAPAPQTATILPLLAVIGSGLLLAGALLRRHA